jgi:hypothetical protein
MEDFWNPGPHARAQAGGEYDGGQGGAQLNPIMPDRRLAELVTPGRSITFL